MRTAVDFLFIQEAFVLAGTVLLRKRATEPEPPQLIHSARSIYFLLQCVLLFVCVCVRRALCLMRFVIFIAQSTATDLAMAMAVAEQSDAGATFS